MRAQRRAARFPSHWPRLAQQSAKDTKNAVGNFAKNSGGTPIIRVPLVYRDKKRRKLPGLSDFWGVQVPQKTFFQHAGTDAAARHEEQVYAIASRKRDGMHKASAQAKTTKNCSFSSGEITGALLGGLDKNDS